MQFPNQCLVCVCSPDACPHRLVESVVSTVSVSSAFYRLHKQSFDTKPTHHLWNMHLLSQAPMVGRRTHSLSIITTPPSPVLLHRPLWRGGRILPFPHPLVRHCPFCSMAHLCEGESLLSHIRSAARSLLQLPLGHCGMSPA